MNKIINYSFWLGRSATAAETGFLTLYRSIYFMTQEPIKSDKPYAMRLAAQLLCLVLIVAILYYLQGIFLLLVFSMMIAMILFPMAAKFEKWKMPRVLSSILSILVAAGVLVGLFYLIINQVVSIGKNGSDIVTKFQSIIDTIINWAHDRFGISQRTIVEKVKASTDSALTNASTYVQTAFSSLGGILANTLLVPIFVFFMLCYRDFFREFFFYAFKSTNQEKVNEILIRIYKVVHSYIFGLITVMGIVAGNCFAG